MFSFYKCVQWQYKIFCQKVESISQLPSVFNRSERWRGLIFSNLCSTSGTEIGCTTRLLWRFCSLSALFFSKMYGGVNWSFRNKTSYSYTEAYPPNCAEWGWGIITPFYLSLDWRNMATVSSRKIWYYGSFGLSAWLKQGGDITSLAETDCILRSHASYANCSQINFASENSIKRILDLKNIQCK